MSTQHISDPKSAETLELPKILQRLAKHTAFSAGRELALRLTPSTDPEEVQRRLQLTAEAKHLLATRPQATIGGARDVRPLVVQAKKGGVLQPRDLLDIRQTLQAARQLRNLILRGRDEFPALARVADRIEPCRALVEAIEEAIGDDGEVKDTASPQLQQIRRDLATTHDRLLEKLQRIISDPRNQPWLQEPIITQRAGRYVIPVKVEHKGRIQGIVHDQSASGATVFVEPLATLELNNRWRELQLAEEREVERVLRELSALVAENGDEIVWTVEALAELDLHMAKAEYAFELKATQPELTSPLDRKGEKPYLLLRQARHPLIDPQQVVPIDVWLGPDFHALVITGPNTGGKTVTLKTVGLLCLMTMCGLHIPAGDGSRVPVFDNVFADIGDEQSIEQSLSTFSSHMTNIIRILEQATRRSLVLIDEIGAGTDPVEGAALARAILSYLVEREISTIVATHYSELKIWAHNTPGVQNASVEFDLETLRPTYRLLIGLPGRSNALHIAERLGLNPEIVQRARHLLSHQDLELESLLADIRVARERAEQEAREAERARREAETLRQQLEERLTRIEEERAEVLNQARQEARAELEEVRALLRSVKRRLERYGQQVAELTTLRDELRRIEKEHLAPARPPAPKTKEESATPEAPLQVGDRVWVPALGRTAEVVALYGDEAEVAAGPLRLRARVAELERRPEEKPSPPRLPPGVRVMRRQGARPARELDLRGMTVEEALPTLEKYLDDAYMAGLSPVRIVHGKGTGALRRAVREALRQHPLVASFRPGDQHEGGDGVTVVELALR